MSERRYRKYWSSSMIGENQDLCVEVLLRPKSSAGTQCNNKRGKGKDGLYCHIHAKQHPTTAAEE